MTISPTYRIMCCLLAALLLFTFVSRPLEVSATGLEAAAAGFVGIAPEIAIPIILVLLGITAVAANWDTICAVVEDAVDGFCQEINETWALPAYNYNGEIYVDTAIMETAADAVKNYYHGTYGDAWQLGKNYAEMNTLQTDNKNHYLVIWYNSGVIKGTTTKLHLPTPCVVYEYYKGQINIYDGTNDTSDYLVWDLAGDTLTSTYVQGDPNKIANPIYGTVVTIDETSTVPVAIATSIPYEETDTKVKVETDTGTGTVPGTSTVDLSGVLSWLKSIWQAISNLAAQITSPIVSALTSVKTAITTGVTTITDAITKTIADIIEWLRSMGATLADILEWIKTLPASIAQAISTVITDIFVPSADFITEKVDAITSRFAWISPLVDIAQGLSVDLSSSTPPVVYVHLEDSESEYIKGGTVKFIDMSWYARYKPYGDVILSGFLWALFAWRMYLKIPGIINGVGGSVGHIASSGGYRRKEDGE